MNSIITGYQTDVEMYYINSLHKITKGTIQGYCIDSAVFDSDGKLLKSTNERYQMKSFNGNVTYEYEFVKPEKIFKNLQDAIEFMCTDSLKLELDEIKNSKIIYMRKRHLIQLVLLMNTNKLPCPPKIMVKDFRCFILP